MEKQITQWTFIVTKDACPVICDVLCKFTKISLSS